MIRKFMPSIYLIAVFLILCGSFSESAFAEENYITLFNGKDLSGWVPVGTPKAFTVKENSIYTTGAGPNPVRHKDCVVIYKWRIAQKLFLQITYFKLALCSHSCLNAFNEQKKA